MAKAKKSTEETTPASSEPKAAPKKKAAAAPAKKTAKPAGGGGFGFGIDTNLAASNAAKMLLNRSASPTSSTGGTVKHLKDSMAKSQAGNLNSFLGGGSGGVGKSSNLPHFMNKQKSQNQATGHVGNTGVPRRTPG
jgi:hypothetical protein